MSGGNADGEFSVAKMPNDTAPEKTGSSENGDGAGRHELPCDLARAQLQPPGF
jgi:hypothetical protein